MALQCRKTDENLKKPVENEAYPDKALCIFYPQHYLSLCSEKEIAELELHSLFDVKINFIGKPIKVTIRKQTLENANRLTFWRKVEVFSDDKLRVIIPNQVLFEKAGYVVKSMNQITFEDDFLQSTQATDARYEKESRYLMHSLHTYKGKFHPQIVKGLINFAGISRGDVVLDPFCGCGTTNLECFFMGIESWGVDFNPLACLVARTRVASLTLSPNTILEATEDFLNKIKNDIEDLHKIREQPNFNQGSIGHSRLETITGISKFSEKPYIPNINKWFRGDLLEELLLIRERISKVRNVKFKDLLTIILSSIVKEVSNWDTSQVRPYLMKQPRTNVDVFSKFAESLWKAYKIVYAYSKLKENLTLSTPSVRIRNEDSRNLHFISDDSIDLVVTSPPYANALPYLETDRLRSILIGLLTWSKMKMLRKDEIGNREIGPESRKSLEKEFLDSYYNSFLPRKIKRIIRKIYEENRKLPDRNFRRKNRAALLYKYFKDMNTCLREIHRVMKSGKYCIIIIGNNRVRAYETWIEIPTDSTVEEMAVQNFGFAVEKRIEKELVHTAHPRKIESETITFLKKD